MRGWQALDAQAMAEHTVSVLQDQLQVESHPHPSRPITSASGSQRFLVGSHFFFFFFFLRCCWQATKILFMSSPLSLRQSSNSIRSRGATENPWPVFRLSHFALIHFSLCHFAQRFGATW